MEPKEKLIADLMESKEAENVMKLAFIVSGYESEKALNETRKEGDQK